jgi:ubiquinone/menaquinone biosynthesis C-methylase UbiE
MAVEPDRYTLTSSDAERTRLARQAAHARPVTERLFRVAGIGAGARVLDVGSGAGDVAMLAAELVGESGSVVGIDRDEAQLNVAATRCSEAGLRHVRFEVCDLDDPPAGPFDAVVGRFVLMYQPDPDATMRALAHRVGPGGVAAFVELALTLGGGTVEALSWPEHPLARSLRSWIHDAFAATNVARLMGLRLRAAFRAAGLEPQEPVEANSIVYTGVEAAEMNAGLVRSMLPVILEHGIATADEVDIDTLADRLIAAAGDEELIYVVPRAIAAWARKPRSAIGEARTRKHRN